MMDRGDFSKGGATGKREVLVSGAKQDCLADAIAFITGDDKHTVRTALGDDRSFDRATEYVKAAHPELALDDVSSTMLEAPGGVAMELLKCTSRKFVLQQTYRVNGKVRYHCAALDMALDWGPVESFDLATGEIVVKRGRGVLVDNQADIKVHLAEASDREKYAARAFFTKPYFNTPDIRITRVYELVSAKEAVARAMTRQALKRSRQQEQANAKRANAMAKRSRRDTLLMRGAGF